MYKKLTSFIIAFVMVFSSFGYLITSSAANKDQFVYSTQTDRIKGEKDDKADSNTSKNKGKVIVVDINRTSLNNFKNISFLRKEMADRGYIGLMNIRGDKGYDDIRNYATFGATGRVNIEDDVLLDFVESSKESDAIYKANTNQIPGKINLLNINEIDLYNNKKGDYKSGIGYLGDILISDGKKIAALGNSDYYVNGQYKKNVGYLLGIMDSKGRVYSGEINNINRSDTSYPYGIVTDYNKITTLTKELYNNNDLLFVNLGDTFRLDEYKDNLNEYTYKKMKFSIYNNISKYLEEIFKMANKNDTIYIVSSFPSRLDYANNKRLAPVVRFDMSSYTKGVLMSKTTRRLGIIANMDLGVDILNRFGLKSKDMNGRAFTEEKIDNNIDYITSEYRRIVAVSSIRIDIINIYVSFISISWIIAALALWKKSYIKAKYRNKILLILKELVKFGLIMPLAFLTAPIFKASTPMHISLSIIAVSLIYYIVARKLFKDDIMQIGFYSLAMIALITIDSVISTPLMQSNIMSYDPIIGARYYGVGNEYEGVTIGSAILGFAILIQKKQIPKWVSAVMLAIILFVSASPGMGANVGGAISESMAYIVFILLIFNIKIDLKKIILLIASVVAIVAGFAVADISFGFQSHLGNFVQQVKINGVMEIVNVFARKIYMNIQLAQTTVWVNILLIGLLILMIMLFVPNKNFSFIQKKYNVIYKGFLATIVGCLITLLVNDSGIIAAATDSIYLLIPILIILINKGVKEKDVNR